MKKIAILIILLLAAPQVFGKTETKSDFQRDLELAELGNPGGQFRTGARYLNGDGVETDYDRALIWLEKAAAQKHSNALYDLGYMYLYGVGVETNFIKAADYFEKSKKGGFLPAYYIMCVMYYDGAGVKQDMSEAYKNCKKAADGGYAPAGRIMDNATKTIVPFKDEDANGRALKDK